MGLEKNIYGYAAYSYYHSDIDTFMAHISAKLNADFDLRIYHDDEAMRAEEEERSTNFGRPNRYKVMIEHYNYNTPDGEDYLPYYSIRIPIEGCEDEDIDFYFYPNHTVTLFCLTFEHTWNFFMEDLKYMELYRERTGVMIEYEKLRVQYNGILKKLGITAILIITDSRYKVELITDDAMCLIEFEDLLNVARVQDNLMLFSFEDIIYAKKIADLDPVFLDRKNNLIGFIDNLEFR